MPYTPQQKHYLDAMGIVPWVLRSHASVQDASDCSVLLVFDASVGGAEDLDDTENRLLLDMLGAIQLPESDVARRSVGSNGSIDFMAEVKPLMTPAVKVVLVVVNSNSDVVDDDEASSRLLMNDFDMPIWQLPHPGWIQQKPALKRRAWNVLKAVRKQLQD